MNKFNTLAFSPIFPGMMPFPQAVVMSRSGAVCAYGRDGDSHSEEDAYAQISCDAQMLDMQFIEGALGSCGEPWPFDITDILIEEYVAPASSGCDCVDDFTCVLSGHTF